jgi:hypothetical protein
MSAEEDAYHELSAYTLTHGDRRFIHQHVVDAYGAQSARADDKPIRLVFALVGLYLHLERGKTGREAQLAHMAMAKRKREWPPIAIPEHRGNLTAIDVMQQPPGPARDQAIDAWCEAVWNAFQGNRDVIVTLLGEYGMR